MRPYSPTFDIYDSCQTVVSELADILLTLGLVELAREGSKQLLDDVPEGMPDAATNFCLARGPKR